MARVSRLFLFPFVGLLVIGLAWRCAPEGDRLARVDQVEFNRHIRPILSDKCFACHGPDEGQRQAGLRLDTEEGAFHHLEDQPGQFAIVPGDKEASELWHRVRSADTSLLMPPPSSNLKLSEEEVALLGRWIEEGAPYQRHWAFIPPRPTEPPRPGNEDWAHNPIDHFVLARMQEHGLSPNPEADPDRLIKRLAFDLTGLPPSLELQARYREDLSEERYEQLVDELLASPHYGEKMAVHWLDVARYADSHGYQDDGLRTMWPWRDWVIHAFNENYPYDKFVTWQLAGDLIPGKTRESLLATGFNRNHKITQEGGVIDEEYRVEYVTDRTNTFGKAFLGLTYECAKCHDHKYDPISQKDYFSTFAFFNLVPEKGIFGTIDASFADPPNMTITDEEVQTTLDFINKQDTADVSVMVMADSLDIRKTYVLNRGLYDQPTTEVRPDTPEEVMPFDTTRFETNRLGLARWLLDEHHPLTARVFVNRVWQEIFGRGLVESTGDFGMQGDMPTHPDLLDWLAVDFRTNGWDIKRLVKQIVLSATYRQSSAVRRDHQTIDPANVYLARAPRKRLKAEFVRDHVLASSGLLHPEIGGPSVKPYQPDGLWEQATSGRGLLTKYVQDHGPDLYRRGMYTFIKRTVPPPKMLMFDGSNRDQCEVERLNTNTPLQALAMMNDPEVLEASRVLAQRLIGEEASPEARIDQAFRRILCRPARQDERAILLEFYQEELTELGGKPDHASSLIQVGEYPQLPDADPVLVAATMQTILMMYNMEETLMKT